MATRRTDNTMAKRKRTKEHTVTYKTLHRRLNRATRSPLKAVGNSGAPGGLAVLAPHVNIDVRELLFTLF